MTEQTFGADDPERDGASNDPADYTDDLESGADPDPDVPAVGATTDLDGRDEEREVGGEADVRSPLP
jgi:hypothetical protein